MKQWAQVMRQWFLWLLGDEPLPGKGTRAMLAGTVAALVVLGAGGLALLPSSTPAKSAAGRVSASDSPLPTLATPTTTTPTASPVTTAPKSAGARARGRARARTHRQGAAARARRPAGTAHRHAGTTNTTTNTTGGGSLVAAPSAPRAGGALAVAAPAADPFTADAASAAPAATPADGAPVVAAATPGAASPLTSPPRVAVTPRAPLATGASTGVDASLVTWKAPEGSPVTGYDVFVGTAPGQEWPAPVNATGPVVGTSYLVTGLTAGQIYYFTVQALDAGARSPVSNEVSATPVGAFLPVGALPEPVVSVAASSGGTGYWLATGSGAVSAHGTAADYGSAASLDLAAPIVQIVSTPDGKGYWEVAADGGVFAFGDASYEGSVAGLRINAPIVGLAPTADGKGYWLLASDGGVFALGDAAFLGSLVGAPASSSRAPLDALLALPPMPSGGGTAVVATAPVSATAPAVGIVGDPATDGYWVVMADGTVTGFGAPNLGPRSGAAPGGTVVGIAADGDGKGYWEVTRSGGVFAYGNAPFHGSAGALALNTPVSGMAVDATSGGYWLAALDGGVFAFDAPFWGAG